jgi:uncharacterized membrane protein
VVLANVGSGLYNFLLFLHILCAIVGFGSVMLNGLYAVQAKKRRGPGGLAVVEANFFVSKIAEYFIYAVFILGILLVVTGNDLWSMSDGWISAAMLLYIIGIAISHAVMIPGTKKIIRLQNELASAGAPPAGASGPPPQVAEIEATGKRLGIFGPILNVLLIVILYLMVFKPGA